MFHGRWSRTVSHSVQPRRATEKSDDSDAMTQTRPSYGGVGPSYDTSSILQPLNGSPVFQAKPSPFRKGPDRTGAIGRTTADEEAVGGEKLHWSLTRKLYGSHTEAIGMQSFISWSPSSGPDGVLQTSTGRIGLESFSSESTA